MGMKVKLADLMSIWFEETFPEYSFDTSFQPFAADGIIRGVGTIFRMDGVPICRVMDTEVVQWINPHSIPNFNAAHPSFFEQVENWIRHDVIPALKKKGVE